MTFRTYVFTARDLRSSDRTREVVRVEATDDAKTDMKKATQAVRASLIYDPAHMWKIEHVWQVIDGGAK